MFSSALSNAFRKPVCSSGPGETPDRKDWPGHLGASGGCVLASPWEAFQEGFDLEQPLGPSAALCVSEKEQKKGSLSVHTL